MLKTSRTVSSGKRQFSFPPLLSIHFFLGSNQIFHCGFVSRVEQEADPRKWVLQNLDFAIAVAIRATFSCIWCKLAFQELWSTKRSAAFPEGTASVSRRFTNAVKSVGSSKMACSASIWSTIFLSKSDPHNWACWTLPLSVNGLSLASVLKTQYLVTCEGTALAQTTSVILS